MLNKFTNIRGHHTVSSSMICILEYLTALTFNHFKIHSKFCNYINLDPRLIFTLQRNLNTNTVFTMIS